MATRTMRAVRIHDHGGPEVLRLDEVPLPEPGPGEVRVRLSAMALNHLDLWVRRGGPTFRAPLPLIPGSDGVGRIDELGEGVAGPLPGTRVYVVPAVSCMRCVACLAGRENHCPSYAILGARRHGTAAEAIVVPAVNVAPLADPIEITAAAAVPLTFLTAWQMVVHKARLAPGERVLVHAGASGLGVALVQLARLSGALVGATASTPAKRALAERLGADRTFDYTAPDWERRVREWAGPRGLAVVFDHVGRDTFAPSLELLGAGGRYVFAGATSGPEASVDLRAVFARNIEILGSSMGRKADLARVMALIAAGRLEPVVDSAFPIERIADAHRRLESREALGKVVVTI